MQKLRRIALAAAALGTAAALATPWAARADQSKQPQNLPENIQVPEGSQLFLVAHAFGTQNYTCDVSTNNWSAATPDADLFVDGKLVIEHTAGPTWTHNDKSSVGHPDPLDPDAKKVAPSPNGDDNIPWLRLGKFTVNTGPGELFPTKWIQRLYTHGGVHPATCTTGTASVPYRAEYWFYR